jgi:hypothetical protein
MEMSRLTEELFNLKKGERRIIYTSEDGTKVTVEHTGRLSQKDFAVGLIIRNKPEFNPTHVRLLIDLYIKRESNLNDFQKLFEAFEKMFQGQDPVKLRNSVRNLNFPMQLDSSETNLYYAQLLMIEQDINYGPDSKKPSKCKPPRDYLMRFIRWLASGDSTIDRIISAAVRNYPAPLKYANKD